MCRVIQLVEVFYGSCGSQESISTIKKETIIVTSNPGHNDKHRDKKRVLNETLPISCQPYEKRMPNHYVQVTFS